MPQQNLNHCEQAFFAITTIIPNLMNFHQKKHSFFDKFWSVCGRPSCWSLEHNAWAGRSIKIPAWFNVSVTLWFCLQCSCKKSVWNPMIALASMP